MMHRPYVVVSQPTIQAWARWRSAWRLPRTLRGWVRLSQSELGQVSVIPNPELQPQQEIVPFRRATLERVETLPQESGTLATTLARFDRTIEGSGFIYGIVLRMVATAASNVASVVFHEDGPWNAYDSIVFRDVNGEIVNLQGYDLYLVQLFNRAWAVSFHGGQGLTQPPRGSVGASGDANVYDIVVGSGGTGGSFTTMARVPVALNRRDLLGLLGNQDRAQKYSLRTDVSALATIYTTAPTNAPTFTIEKFYENYAVPLPQTPLGVTQEILPPGFGTIQFHTAHVSESVPAASSTQNHYLKRLGNTLRGIMLIFRSNSLRSTAHTNAPTNIRFKVGEDTIFNESYAYRRMLMFERYGIDFPNGVLVYEAVHDFGVTGFELGDDYYHTQSIVNAQFQITYPSGWTDAGSSLRIITIDLQRIGVPIQ